MRLGSHANARLMRCLPVLLPESLKVFLRPWAPPGMGLELTSRSSQHMRQKWNCAYSIRVADEKWNASNCPNIPTKSGMDVFLMRGPGRFMAIEFMGRTSQKTVIASIRTNCYWIHMLRHM